MIGPWNLPGKHMNSYLIFLKICKQKTLGWDCSSVLKHLPTIERLWVQSPQHNPHPSRGIIRSHATSTPFCVLLLPRTLLCFLPQIRLWPIYMRCLFRLNVTISSSSVMSFSIETYYLATLLVKIFWVTLCHQIYFL